nr:FKBP-type peptidyl-prolyl cis-trans isomerase [Theileria orientalis]
MGEPIDVSGDGGVLKTVLKPSDSNESPENGHEVEVHYTGKLESGKVFDSSYDRNTTFKFELGNGNVIKGWDLGVATMKVGERSEFVIQPNYGYGESGAGESIPPNSVLKFEIELINTRVKPKNKWELSIDEKIQVSRDLKAQGNSKFSFGNFTSAISLYSEAVDYLDEASEWPEESRKEANTTLLQCHLNLANCHLKVANYKSAESSASEALKLDKASVKGYFRRALARIHEFEFEKAIGDLNEVLKLDRDNKDALNYLSVAKSRLRECNEKDKKGIMVDLGNMGTMVAMGNMGNMVTQCIMVALGNMALVC